MSEHVSLRFRRGQRGLASGKEALRAAPTAAALHLLPPSSPHWFLRQVQHAETPSPSVPCSSSPGLQSVRPAGSCSPRLLGGLGLDGRGAREGLGKDSVWGAGPIVNQSLPPRLSFRRLRALWCPFIVGAGRCRVDCGVMVCDLVGLRGRVRSLEEGRGNSTDLR